MSSYVSHSSKMEEDSTSPYHLQNGDSPRSYLIMQPLLGDNYHTWPHSMEMALILKNNIGFVNGLISQPLDTSNRRYHAWLCCTTMVLS